MSVLQSKSISVSIGSKSICTNLNYVLNPGECWGLLGSNGVGKTTLLHALAGMKKPDKGSIFLDNREISRYWKKNLARKTGVLFQDSEDIFPATVIETVLTGRHPHLPFWSFESSDDYRIAEKTLKKVALAEMANRQVNTLSGGERRRLAIATLMVQNPDIWLLDEPTNHLDLRHQILLLNIIVHHAAEHDRGILMVLHDANLVLRFCTHAMLMINHQSILCGSVPEIITLENLQQLYQHPFRMLEDDRTRLFYPV